MSRAAIVCAFLHAHAGAAAVLRYGETFDDVPLVVNVAGRFDTRETPRSRFTEEQWDALETTGSFQWNVKVCLCVCVMRSRFVGGGVRTGVCCAPFPLAVHLLCDFLDVAAPRCTHSLLCTPRAICFHHDAEPIWLF